MRQQPPPQPPPARQATHAHFFPVALDPEPVPDEWCPVCLVPSMVRMRVFLLTETCPGHEELTVMFHGTIEYCYDHGGEARWVTQ